MLVLVRFGGELAGRIASHVPGCGLHNCAPRTAVLVLAVATIVRSVLLVVVLVDVFWRGYFFDLERLWLFIIVGIFYALFGWSQSEVMTTVVDVGPPEKDGDLARGMMCICFASQLLSLAIALTLIEIQTKIEIHKTNFILWSEAKRPSVIRHPGPSRSVVTSEASLPYADGLAGPLQNSISLVTQLLASPSGNSIPLVF